MAPISPPDRFINPTRLERSTYVNSAKTPPPANIFTAKVSKHSLTHYEMNTPPLATLTTPIDLHPAKHNPHLNSIWDELCIPTH